MRRVWWHIRNKSLSRSCLLAFVVIACSAVWLQAGKAAEGSRFDAEYFSNAVVEDHRGRKHRFFDDLIRDRIVVVNFIYLSCNDLCPLSTSRLAEVQDRLGDVVGSKVQFLTITMNPEKDSSAELRAYAEAFSADDGWLFVTGNTAQIKKIRYQLGERSRSLGEHRNDLVLGNDRTGEWSRISVYSDIEILVRTIKELAGIDEKKDVRAIQAAEIPDASRHDRYRLDRAVGEALFIKTCSTCHTIGGGKLVGPDLKDVDLRRPHDWLKRFMMAPERMRAEADEVTLALSAEYPGVNMPNLGLGERDVEDLLHYIRTQSQMKAKATEQSETDEEAGL